MTVRIRKIHKDNRRVYGSPRIHAELVLADGERIGRKRVERLMRVADISGLIRRRRSRTTVRVPRVRVCDDLVDRAFAAEAPNRIWVADIAYLRTWQIPHAQVDARPPQARAPFAALMAANRIDGLGASLGGWLRRAIVPPTSDRPQHPGLLKQAEERAQDAQSRVADGITAFAGSMPFVYLHVIWFASWIVFGVEEYPYGLLTMIVSLEAIFLSTFVMISQNRADAKRQIIADEEWTTVQNEDRQNQELLDLSKQILQLTKEVRAHAQLADGSGPPTSSIAQEPAQ